MQRFDRFVLKYITAASLPVFGLLIWGSIGNPDQLSMDEGAIGFIWDALGGILILWVLFLLYLMSKMMLAKSLREEIFCKMARIQERDEREEHLSGEAAKFSLLSTLSMLLLLLFFSLFSVGISKFPEGAKKSVKVSIGMRFNPIVSSSTLNEAKEENGQTLQYLQYNGLPFSGPLIILLIIFWQLGSYKIIMRKLSRESENY